MTKRKTQKNISKTGRKRRFKSEAQKETLNLAHKARRMRNELKRVSDIDNEVPIVHPAADHNIEQFLEDTVSYCLERQLLIKSGEYPKMPFMGCHHHMTIGSSAMGRLLNSCYTVEKMHHSSYYHGAYCDGNYWEDKMSRLWQLTCNNVRYSILSRISHPTGISHNYPWLVATPDFIWNLQGSDGKPFYAIVEIKSTENCKQYESPAMEYYTQVQASMEVFNLDAGFLIMCLVNNKTKRLHEYSVFSVDRNKIFKQPAFVMNAYATFVL